jgi:Uma2 family endonuclease
MFAEAVIAEKKYTIEEYFELEKTSEIRHEFVDGILIPMPGESKIANKICRKIVRQLEDTLNSKVFEIFNHDVRTFLNNGKTYRYPDVVVAPIVDEEDSHAVMQPILIVEVFSDNSLKTDTVDKLKEYLSLPTMQYYLIVSQAEPFVEVYSRNESKWEFTFCSQLDEIISLPKLNAELTMKGVYDGVF